MTSLPPFPPVQTICDRLPLIFPEGLDQRTFLIREMSAKAIFVMLYTGAISGEGVWVRPDQVTKMTDAQTKLTDDEARIGWRELSLKPGAMQEVPSQWYAANTRESIRDETLRAGLILAGAVIVRQGLPTTSSKPRYALEPEFAKLFDLDLQEPHLTQAIADWQDKHLSPQALARIRLATRTADTSGLSKKVLVKTPSGESRWMAPGESSMITKDVIEVFVKHFLEKPALLFLSESGNKVVSQDHELATLIGLNIQADKNLPDIILADLRDDGAFLVFVEVVHSDGAITTPRREAFLELTRSAQYPDERVRFVSAFRDRGSAAYRKLGPALAPDTFAWFCSEPDSIVAYMSKLTIRGRRLSELQ